MRNIVVLVLFCASLFANALILDSNFSQMPLLQQTEFAKSELNVTLQEAKQLNFLANSSTNFGVGNFAIWSKVKLCNNTPDIIDIYFTNLRAGVDEIDVYALFSSGKTASFILGDDRGNSAREHIDRFSSFSIKLQQYESVIIYTRQANFHGPVEANWLIQSKKNYIQDRFYDTLFWGVFIGLMTALIVYNLAIFFAIKNKEYIYYAGLGIFSMLSQLQVSGVLHAIVPDFLVVFINNITFFVVILTIICAMAFNYYFFDVKKNFAKLKNIFYIMYCIYGALFIVGLIDIGLTVQYIIITTALVTVTLLFLLMIGVLSCRLKIRGTYFYIIGQGILFITYLIATILINGKNAITIWTYLAIPISIFIEMIFLSFALSVRVKNINDLKQKQEKMIVFFSHINSMSGMLNSILHQWKKPIERLGAIFTELEIATKYGKEPLEKLDSSFSQINNNLAILHDTTQEFYNLYNNRDDKELVDVYLEIAKIAAILKSDIENHSIIFDYSSLQDLNIQTYRHPFFHTFFILINNAFEVATRREIKSPIITMVSKHFDGFIELYITDNCGGIKQNPIDSIFEISVTDDVSDKTIKGSGLAIAKMLIIEKLKGDISALNVNNGAIFIVKIPI